MAQLQSDMSLMIHRLWHQALSGDTDGALYELEQMDLSRMSVAALDLLARLYVRQGRLDRAREIWDMILRSDPGFSPAVRAIRKLNSPWLIQVIAIKYSIGFAVSLVVVFGIFAAAYFCFTMPSKHVFIIGAAFLLAIFSVYVSGLFVWAYLTKKVLFGIKSNLFIRMLSAVKTSCDK